jgi:hypothetical protein
VCAWLLRVADVIYDVAEARRARGGSVNKDADSTWL